MRVLCEQSIVEEVEIVAPFGPSRKLFRDEFFVVKVSGLFFMAVQHLLSSREVYFDIFFEVLFNMSLVESGQTSTQFSEFYSHLNKGFTTHRGIGLQIFWHFLDPVRLFLIVNSQMGPVHRSFRKWFWLKSENF